LFLDLERWLAPVRQTAATPFWTDDGVQLNQLGYWMTSAALENDLQLRPSGWKLSLDAAGTSLDLSGAKLDGLQRSAERLAFRLESTSLPLTAPMRRPGHTGQMTVKGLKAGQYVLTIDGKQVAEASAEGWQQGVGLDCVAELEQLESLRRAIVKKNELYSQGWRARDQADRPGAKTQKPAPAAAEPHGSTPQLIEQETEIARLRIPRGHRFELSRRQGQP
jgi:hypothetical protein